MKRVLIIGCGGSGKTTLATQLGEFLQLPVCHLDTLFWKPGWIPSTSEEFEERFRPILEEETWIMDGNYGGTLELRARYADTIIYLDLPTIVCVYSALKRVWEYREGARPDMTVGNAERIDFEFLRWILTYRRSRRPKILKFLAELKGSKEVLVLESRKEISQLLETVSARYE